MFTAQRGRDPNPKAGVVTPDSNEIDGPSSRYELLLFLRTFQWKKKNNKQKHLHDPFGGHDPNVGETDSAAALGRAAD